MELALKILSEFLENEPKRLLLCVSDSDSYFANPTNVSEPKKEAYSALKDERWYSHYCKPKSIDGKKS